MHGWGLHASAFVWTINFYLTLTLTAVQVLNVGKQAVDRVEQPISGLKVQSARKACRMHLRLLYVDFPKDQMESAGKEMKQRGGGPAAERAALQRLDPELRRLMGGGVLYVRVVSAEDLDLGHKPWIVGGWRHKIKVGILYQGFTVHAAMALWRPWASATNICLLCNHDMACC